MGGKCTNVCPRVGYVFAGLETQGETVSGGIRDENRPPHSGTAADAMTNLTSISMLLLL